MEQNDGGSATVVAFKASHYTRGKDGAPSEVTPPLSADADKGDQDTLVAAPATAVRRLTPRECERLQGFPDDHTAITYRGKPAADGPRYRAIGNSMAVNVMRWIGQRIAAAELDRPLRYLSVCSGIEAASTAWHDLGWALMGVSEIEPFASAVLAARFPETCNFGDLTQYASWPLPVGSVDLLVGGTPCQSFSVAGLRKGLDDPRGNLALTYLGLVDLHRPRWIVYENVPGLLSVDGGRAFGAFVGALAELGYGWAYRVLDAQYVRVDSHPRAVPQRRRRVFVVGCAAGDWKRAAEVLLERPSVCGDPPARGPSPARAAGGAASGTRGVAGTVSAKWSKGTGGPAGDETQNLVEVPDVAATRGVRGVRSRTELDGHGAHVVEVLAFDPAQITHPENRSRPEYGDPSPTLHRFGGPPHVAIRGGSPARAAAPPEVAHAGEADDE
jgi:DNA (cytosine-5)-methyltransferase 1